MAKDEWGSAYEDLAAPSDNFKNVVPSDSVPFTKTTKSFYVGVGGNIRVQPNDAAAPVDMIVADCTYHPLRISQVFSTGTDAQNIVAIF